MITTVGHLRMALKGYKETAKVVITENEIVQIDTHNLGKQKISIREVYTLFDNGFNPDQIARMYTMSPEFVEKVLAHREVFVQEQYNDKNYKLKK